MVKLLITSFGDKLSGNPGKKFKILSIKDLRSFRSSDQLIKSWSWTILDQLTDFAAKSMSMSSQTTFNSTTSFNTFRQPTLTQERSICSMNPNQLDRTFHYRLSCFTRALHDSRQHYYTNQELRVPQFQRHCWWSNKSIYSKAYVVSVQIHRSKISPIKLSAPIPIHSIETLQSWMHFYGQCILAGNWFSSWFDW